MALFRHPDSGKIVDTKRAGLWFFFFGPFYFVKFRMWREVVLSTVILVIGYLAIRFGVYAAFGVQEALDTGVAILTELEAGSVNPEQVAGDLQALVPQLLGGIAGIALGMLLFTIVLASRVRAYLDKALRDLGYQEIKDSDRPEYSYWADKSYLGEETQA